VSLRSATWNSLPWKFEAGTPPIAEAVGLGAACDYLRKIGMGRIRAQEEKLSKLAIKLLQEREARIFGPLETGKRTGVISFALDNIHPHDISAILDGEGIQIRSGYHCAEPLAKILSVPGTARASFYFYNTEGEAERLAAGLGTAKEVFRK
jgi:cysteine desulfurase/selenocysteine lyase